MRRTAVLLIVLVLPLVAVLPASATSAGLGIGFDPTGLLLFSALTEVSVSEFIDIRAEAGFAVQEDIKGLMLATATVLGHYTVTAFDPFLGVGIGAALTPPPFSTGLVLEAVAGLRILPVDAVAFALHVRYLLRYTAGVWTTGPVYEGALLIRF